MRFYIADVFAENKYSGNPLAVLLYQEILKFRLASARCDSLLVKGNL